MSEFDLGYLTGVLTTSLTLLALALIRRRRRRRQAKLTRAECVEELLRQMWRRPVLLKHVSPIDPERERRAAKTMDRFAP